MQRVLLISNARAGSVSFRTTEVIAKALSADFKLEVADTVARDHASDLSRAAVEGGYDALVAFGGDGTINEAAQGLVGTDVALGILPGGSTNVMARALGLPTNPVDATAVVAARMRSGTTRRINVGKIGSRYFLFSAGMGLDAEVVRRVEADPDAKRKGDWAWVGHALRAAIEQYRGAKPEVTLEVDGEEPARVLLVVCCNARPFTYFGRFPVDACPQARLDGALDVFALERVRLGTIPRLAWSLFVSRSHTKWRSARYCHDLRSLRLTADRPMPVQVDGDYIGEWSVAPIELSPSSLDLLV